MADDLPHPAVRPAATAQLDRDLATAVKRLHRVRWILVSIAAAILVVVTVAGGIVVTRLLAEERASCAAWRAISVAPLPVTPTVRTPQPSRLAVSILDGARVAYQGQACGAPLPPPGPGLVKWAAYYHIPLHR